MNNPQEFNKDERQRYSRHFVLPGFGESAQKRLKQSSVLVVGAGGLGSPALLYLAAAGIGRLGIADADNVTVSNLQRQVLFTTADVGLNKAIAAMARVRALNPNIDVQAYPDKVTSANAKALLSNYDIIVDATDNFPTRYLLNDACVLSGKPLVYGSVFRYEGQVAVFNFNNGPNYRDLYPLPPAPGSVPDCEQGGVLGVLPGVIGCIQANEVIKLIVGAGENLAGKLLLVDLQTMAMDVIAIPDQNQRQKITNLIDYDEFCGLPAGQSISKIKSQAMKEVTVLELKAMMDGKEDFQLIDCREPHEADICEIGGELIPQGDIPHNVDKISKDKKVIIHCRSGARSGRMVQWLEANHGFTNLYNLKGGILAWSDQVDPEVEKY
jgi:molybdopterin/thiamine biosynthesis adenylyltransferase/rhodanese-related sulfurtransferase